MAPTIGYEDVAALDLAKAKSLEASSDLAGTSQGGVVPAGGTLTRTDTDTPAGLNDVRANRIDPDKAGSQKSYSPTTHDMAD